MDTYTSMSGEFEDYNCEADKKMYADHTRWCQYNGKFSHWDKDGKYKHHWSRHSRQNDIWDKAEREQEVWLKAKRQNEIQMEQESIERNKQHDTPWYEDDRHIRRAAEKKTQRGIDAAIEFLASKGINVR